MQVMMNATLPPSKRSRVEREMDWLILAMFALLLIMCIIGAVAYSVWTSNLSPDQWSASSTCPTPHPFIPMFSTPIQALAPELKPYITVSQAVYCSVIGMHASTELWILWVGQWASSLG